MRIEFRVDGGLAAFPGLAKPVSIDCSALPAPAGERLRDLVHRARLFALPAEQGAALPDARAYTIAVDDDSRCRTVTVREPITDPALQELIAELEHHAAVERRGR